MAYLGQDQHALADSPAFSGSVLPLYLARKELLRSAFADGLDRLLELVEAESLIAEHGAGFWPLLFGECSGPISCEQ